MKLRISLTLIIAMFLFSDAAVAEILPWGSGDTSGSASAAASHGDEYDYDDDSGDNGYYTTVAGTFQYYYEALTDIETYLNLYDGWGRSVAIASADTDMVDAYCAYDIDYSTWEFDTDAPDPVSGSKYFSAYTGVYAEWDVVTVCQIEEGTWSNAFASSYAYAQAAMQ